MNSGMNCRLKKLFIAMALVQCATSYAASVLMETPQGGRDYRIRATGQFLAGGEQQLGGFGDVMLPIWQQADRMVFLDGSVMAGQSNRATYSGGLGYRSFNHLFQNDGILGAFTFVDYFKTELNNAFWQLNPGLEWLTVNNEVRIQGFIPLSSKKQTYTNLLASNIPAQVLNDSGRTNTLSGSSGHRIFDTPVNLIEQVGNGIEVEVGQRFDIASGSGTWLRVGGYHYQFNGVPDVNGVQANLEVGINSHVSLMLQNNYDNQNKNRFSAGIRANFGGVDAPFKSLKYRMQAPIIRHQARQSYGEKDPTRLNFQASGSTFNVVGNAWFFSPTGTPPPGTSTTLSSCTAESPCLTIDSATAAQIQLLDPSANLLFETGSYVIPQDPRNGMSWVNLQNGQSILGRNLGWFTPATGSARPQIYGGLFWGNHAIGGIANGTIRNAQVINTNQFIPASFTGQFREALIAAGATGDLMSVDSMFNATFKTPLKNTTTDVFGLFARQNIISDQSDINVEATMDAGTGALNINGIFARNDIFITGGSQHIMATSVNRMSIFGVSAGNDASIANSNQRLDIDSTNGFVQGVGIFANNTITIESNSTILSGLKKGTGFFGFDGVASQNNATISNSSQTISSISSGPSSPTGNGLYILGDLNLSGSVQTVNVSANSGTASPTGIIAARNSVIKDNHQFITASSVSGEADATGITTSNELTVINNQSSVQASVLSGTGLAFAQGNIAEISNIEGSSQTVTATSSGGDAQAFGYLAFTHIYVNQSNVLVSANSIGGMAEATGIDGDLSGGGSGNSSVVNTVINVNGNGTNTKCKNIPNSDGSCA